MEFSLKENLISSFINKKDKICVVGLGYVGLPLAVAFSKKFSVIGFDINKERICTLKQGIDSNNEINKSELETSNITYSYNPNVISECKLIIVAVPTPIDSHKTPDLSCVANTTRTIAKHFSPGSTVVYESTVYPGVTEDICVPILEQESSLVWKKDFFVGYSPERINPGDPKWNVYNIPRNIGSLDRSRIEEVASFYEDFLEGEINRVSSLKVAEATKIVENAFRDINIAYVNELAKSFDAMSIDLIETIKGSSNKPFAFLTHWPGRGVGGHCIAVDPYYLIKRAAESGFDHRFLKIAREVNNSMPLYTVSRLQEGLNDVEKSVKGTKVALLGLSYKANIADLRESPCLEILDILKNMGAKVTVFDPFVLDMSDVKSLEEALDSCEAVVLGTYHNVFGDLTKEILKRKNIKVVVDGMNKLKKDEFDKKGVIYRGIGR